MARLAIYRGTALERELVLTGRAVRLGRADQNDVVLEDPSKAVSREHAELTYRNGGYVLTDLESENGLWVAGQRRSTVVLTPDQPITLGPYTLILRDSAGPSSESTYPGTPLEPGATVFSPDVRPRQSAPRSGPPNLPPRYRPRRALRLGRPVVFAAFTVLVAMLVGVALLFGGFPSARPVPSAAASEPIIPVVEPTIPRNELSPVLAPEPAVANTVDTPAATPRPAPATRPVHAPPRVAAAPETPPTVDLPALQREAIQLIERGSYDEALRILDELYRQPQYAAGAADQIGQLVARIVRGALDAGRRLETTSDWLDAQKSYDVAARWVDAARRYPRAPQSDSAQVAALDGAKARMHQRRLNEGSTALSRAKQFDAMRSVPGQLSQARAEYERAFRILPDDEPGKQVAKGWLDANPVRSPNDLPAPTPQRK